MTLRASSTSVEGLRLHKIASVKNMHSKGPMGIIQKTVSDRHIDVHLNQDATYQTKAFLVMKHLT